MKNTGLLFANDVNADRIKAVVGNFHRLGVVNSVICCYDGRKFSKVGKYILKLNMKVLEFIGWNIIIKFSTFIIKGIPGMVNN